MTQANVYEQYFLELINAERAKTGAQPLAFNDNLNTAAELHSQWMIATDTFSHTGAGGSDPGARMQSAGYAFTGSWTWGENIALASVGGAPGYDDEVRLLHTNLMNSPDHKANILHSTYQEIGLGFEVGPFGQYQSALITEDFAKSGSLPFLTGVAFRDLDGDHFYDPGEGIAGLNVTVVSSGGATYSATTGAAGGYTLRLPASNYTVTFSGANIASDTEHVSMGAQNVKLDLVNPASSSTGSPNVPAPPADTTPPTLASANPSDNSTNVAVGANLVLTFSEAVKAGSGNIVLHNSSDGSTVANIAVGDSSQVSFSGSTLTINPASDLAPGTHYYVTINSGAIQDLAGNVFAGISAGTDWDFTTASPPPSTPVSSWPSSFFPRWWTPGPTTSPFSPSVTPTTPTSTPPPTSDPFTSPPPVSAPTPVSSPASPWLHPNWWTGHADNEQTLSFSAGAQGVTSDSHAGDVVEPPAMVGTTSDSSADATGGNVADVLADAYTADPVHTGPFAFHGGVDLF